MHSRVTCTAPLFNYSHQPRKSINLFTFYTFMWGKGAATSLIIVWNTSWALVDVWRCRPWGKHASWFKDRAFEGPELPQSIKANVLRLKVFSSISRHLTKDDKRAMYTKHTLSVSSHDGNGVCCLGSLLNYTRKTTFVYKLSSFFVIIV